LTVIKKSCTFAEIKIRQMQAQLPFFPENTKLITSTLGFRKQDGFVYYLHNGNPIYCHNEDDRNGYHFILGNLVVNNLCTISELSKSLGERRRNIERYAKSFRENGASHFFSRKETRGQCYKVTDEVLSKIQTLLDKGYSQYSIAKELSISSSAISYHIKNDRLHLKKKAIQNK
jgi:biotin operon repressor